MPFSPPSKFSAWIAGLFAAASLWLGGCSGIVSNAGARVGQPGAGGPSVLSTNAEGYGGTDFDFTGRTYYNFDASSSCVKDGQSIFSPYSSIEFKADHTIVKHGNLCSSPGNDVTLTMDEIDVLTFNYRYLVLKQGGGIFEFLPAPPVAGQAYALLRCTAFDGQRSTEVVVRLLDGGNPQDTAIVSRRTELTHDKVSFQVTDTASPSQDRFDADPFHLVVDSLSKDASSSFGATLDLLPDLTRLATRCRYATH